MQKGATSAGETEISVSSSMQNKRESNHGDIIRKMFDFDLEVSELDNNLFSVKEKIEVIFNFMDLFFQL